MYGIISRWHGMSRAVIRKGPAVAKANKKGNGKKGDGKKGGKGKGKKKGKG
jgi:hypothetical protein